MVIPEAVERGKTAVIKCMYDLENEELYQVKWYRGDREFCRYAPKDVPPLKIFPLHGIEVDRDASDWEKVTIKALSYRANGNYSCEISADAPSFITAQLHGTMYVVDLPKGYPKLRGMKIGYKPGMKLKVECISPNSMPPANITFYVNDEPAHEKHVYRKVSGGTNGSLWTSYGTIQFVVQHHHFIDGKLRIRCLAVIYSIYAKSHEKTTTLIDYRTTIPPEPVTRPRIVFPESYNQESRLAEHGSDAWSISENSRNEIFIVNFLTILLIFILFK
ncbi:unnamed protein product [Euphydryas editha]|uniref:Ig-like domain-containing protein n=1 Tax=Euphydryas editha TaxID=104508 RepID=A0AAU9VD45_EUPED|nr:unnamed protein product [Euphydryas editha]